MTRVPVLGLLSLLCFASVSAWASDARGHLAIEYQFIHVDGFEATTGKLDIGTTDTHAINLEGEFHFGRWTVSAGIPWVNKRYEGSFPHDPDGISPPVDSEFIDDGSYHSGLQDLHLGVRYLLHETPFFSLSPFAYYGLPSNEYTFFGHAAIGQQLQRLGVGINIGWFPAFSDFYVLFSPGYEFVEETLDTNIDHWRISAEVGYFFRPGFSGRVFTLIKEGRGRDFPDDFPTPRNDEWWYQHDRMVKHNYTNVGVGLGWQLSPAHQASVSAMTMVHAEQVHIMKYAITLGLGWSF